ncbi:hypothetical protein AAF712_001919 [Marasmius tenuissimus]|uniref:Translocator protein n=1 Tax=Marasmius tenuissimus TaxID=585030 RepID=A0ABR3ACI6_9AGAR
MSSNIYIPQILLSIPRNPVTAVGLPLVLGILSGTRTGSVVRGQWYRNLRVPPGRPPPQVFPIVWSTLYISMGYASHLAVKALDSAVLSTTRSALTLGLALYYAQLSMNFLWSPLFFNAKQVGLALIDCTLLAGTTFYMTVRAHWLKITNSTNPLNEQKLLDEPTGSKTTMFLLPYCAWLTLATYLNGGIWWLNRGRRDLSKED